MGGGKLEHDLKDQVKVTAEQNMSQVRKPAVTWSRHGCVVKIRPRSKLKRL